MWMRKGGVRILFFLRFQSNRRAAGGKLKHRFLPLGPEVIRGEWVLISSSVPTSYAVFLRWFETRRRH